MESRKSRIITIFLMIFFGTCMHFVVENVPYEPLAKALGNIFPVNESSWEHMKMIWYPFLVAGIALSIRFKNKKYFGTFVLCALGAMMVQLGAFAFYQSIVGVSNLPTDICIYFISMSICSLIAFAIEKDDFFNRTWVFWLIIAVIITAEIVYLTYYPGSGYVFLEDADFIAEHHH